MTCISAVTTPTHIYMGADRCVSTTYEWAESQEPKVDSRTLDSGEPILLGSCGDCTLSDIQTYDLKLPRYPAGLRPREWIRTVLCSNLRDTCRDYGVLRKVNDVVTYPGIFLVAFQGSIYTIYGDFSVIVSPPWGTAIGSGGEAARGSLYTSRDVKDGRVRVLSSLESAEAVANRVRRPFDVLSTEVKEH